MHFLITFCVKVFILCSSSFTHYCHVFCSDFPFTCYLSRIHLLFQCKCSGALWVVTHFFLISPNDIIRKNVKSSEKIKLLRNSEVAMCNMHAALPWDIFFVRCYVCVYRIHVSFLYLENTLRGWFFFFSQWPIMLKLKNVRSDRELVFVCVLSEEWSHHYFSVIREIWMKRAKRLQRSVGGTKKKMTH